MMHRLSALFGLSLLLFLNTSEAFIPSGPDRFRMLDVPIDSFQARKSPKGTASQCLAASKNKKDKEITPTSTPTNIEEGSPLGVAIVVIGSLLWFATKGESDSNTVGDVPVVGIIFGTASTAAGIARLVRYNNNKGNRNN